MEQYRFDMSAQEELSWCIERTKELRVILTQKEPRIPRKDMVCSFCGNPIVYAKGLCKACYTRYRIYGSPEHHQRIKKEKPIKVPIPWEIKLFQDVLGKDTDLIPPTDLSESVMIAIKSLTPREQQVILSRYKDRKTLTEIGKEQNVSKERIRQIQTKSLRHLRHPTRRIFLTDGVCGVKNLNNCRKNLVDTLMQILYNRTEESIKNYGRDLDIEYLDLHTRSINCLKRHGIITISQLIDFAGEGNYIDRGERLLKVKSLGRKSAEDILEKLDYFLQEGTK